jgi:hypothetical protein
MDTAGSSLGRIFLVVFYRGLYDLLLISADMVTNILQIEGNLASLPHLKQLISSEIE